MGFYNPVTTDWITQLIIGDDLLQKINLRSIPTAEARYCRVASIVVYDFLCVLFRDNDIRIMTAMAMSIWWFMLHYLGYNLRTCFYIYVRERSNTLCAVSYIVLMTSQDAEKTKMRWRQIIVLEISIQYIFLPMKFYSFMLFICNLFFSIYI